MEMTENRQGLQILCLRARCASIAIFGSRADDRSRSRQAGRVPSASRRLSDESFSTRIGGSLSTAPQSQDEVAEPDSFGFLTNLIAFSVPLRRERGGHHHNRRFFRKPAWRPGGPFVKKSFPSDQVANAQASTSASICWTFVVACLQAALKNFLKGRTTNEDGAQEPDIFAEWIVLPFISAGPSRAQKRAASLMSGQKIPCAGPEAVQRRGK